jgi:carbon-monoxide dehydrogenase large subunit
LQTGCYDISASQNELIGVYTTTTPTGPYRGAGRPEAAYLIERMMDELAAEIGTDPAEVRRLNFIPKSAFPYTNPGDMTYDSGDYGRTLDRVLALADYPALRASQAAARREGRLQGIGLSTYVESAAGFGTDQATMRLEPDGRLTVITGSTPHGQGHETTWAQIAADQFGVPLEQVAVVYGDTDAPSYAEGTFGSRSAAVSGMAVRQAAVALKKRIRRLAADQFEAAAADVVLEEGRVFVRGVPSRALSLAQVAMAAGGNGKADRLSVEASYEPPDSVYPFGAHLAHVEIDPESGAIKVLRYIAVDDCGRVINPMIVEGQVHGGITQGLAQALFEEAIFDPDGQLLTGNLTTYLMPTAPDTPSFETDRTETPSPNNAMGVKGIGEGATIGSTPAVVNAVMDALRPLGIRHLDMPLTPFKIWQALQPVDT